MALANPNQAFPGPPYRTVLADGFNKIRTAGWLESTVGAEQGTDTNLVDPDQKNHQLSGQPDDLNDNRLQHTHAFVPGSGIFSFRASRTINRFSDWSTPSN